MTDRDRETTEILRKAHRDAATAITRPERGKSDLSAKLNTIGRSVFDPSISTASSGKSGLQPAPPEWSDANDVKPLIDGEEVFAELHKSIVAIEPGGFVYLAFWMLDPAFHIVAKPPREAFRALLKEKLSNRVRVRIMVWDMMEAVLKNGPLPVADWFVDSSPAVTALRLLLGADGAATFLYYYSVKIDELRKWVADLRSQGLDIDARVVAFPDPGSSAGRGVAPGLGLPLGSHHQKFAVMGGPNRGTQAYVMGLNIDDHYWDDSRHKMTYPETGESIRDRPWHDTGLCLTGSIVAKAEREFVRRWNLSSDSPLPLSKDPPAPAVGSVQARLLVTTPEAQQIREALRARLRAARTCIYAEDQYFCNAELIQDICDAAVSAEKQGQPLQIALLTNGPEQFQIAGVARPLEFYRHVNFANLRLATCSAIELKDGTRVQRAAGQRWRLTPEVGTKGCWDLAKLKLVGASDAPILLSEIKAMEGGVQPSYIVSTTGEADKKDSSVYIHSKTTIIDDQYAFVGNANYSVRSQEYDSEVMIEVANPAFASLLRGRLFEEMLDELDPGASVQTHFTRWHTRAQANATALEAGGNLAGTNVSLIRYPTSAPNTDLTVNAMLDGFELITPLPLWLVESKGPAILEAIYHLY